MNWLADKIEQWPTAKLVPYARNARTHSDGQVAQIAASIAEFGFTNPILAGSDGVIVAGHGRLAAAQKLGLDAVPVVVLDHLTPTQRRALVIADNRIAENAGWDDERPDRGIFDWVVALGVPAVIWGGNYFADMLPATRGWLYWSKGQDGLTMSDGELAWTTEDKPLRSKTINRAHLNGSVHPTQKPVQIIEFSVDYLKVPQKGAVLDLFAGSGTLAIVCEKTDRRSFLMERDPGYVDVIVRRWQEFTGKQATHEATGATFAEVEADSALAVAEDV